jgi:hypothetical protein
MSTERPRTIGDATPVIGGISPPDHLIHSPVVDEGAPEDELGRQAYWLLKLHPDKVSVSLKFRNSDLSAMDDATKRLLIADIQHALGVRTITGAVL